MLETVVVKFGGSVLENEKAITQVASLIKETKGRGLGVVVVVSAMKGVTDQIMALSKKRQPRDRAAPPRRAPLIRGEDERAAWSRRRSRRSACSQ